MVSLPYRAPFAWDHFLRFLRARSIAGIERCDATSYTRTLRSGNAAGWVCVENDAVQSALRLTLSPSLNEVRTHVSNAVARMFDTGADPLAVQHHLSADTLLGPLVSSEPGLRLPGAVDAFELAMRGILGQQVTVAAAHTLCGRVVARYAEPIADAPGLTHLPVRAETLASADPEEIASLGMPRTRARTLVLLARAIFGGEVSLLSTRDPAEVMVELRRIPGIGPWTAEYITMRALSWQDAFPAADLGIRNALGGVTAQQALQRAEAWRPFRAYAVIHLWNSLAPPRLSLTAGDQ
jgi:AraC family transcriptional regulator of adaptative response / DNA-3-methyladenine glycosylase II